MNAAAPLFDRLIYVQRLRNAGVDEQQAIAQADALDGAFRESVATKTDISEVDRRIDVLEASIKAEFAVVRGQIAMVRGEISAVRTDLAAAIQRQTVWLGGTMIALLAIGVTLAKTL